MPCRFFGMPAFSEKALEQHYGKESLKLQFLTEKLYEVIVDYVTVGE